MRPEDVCAHLSCGCDLKRSELEEINPHSGSAVRCPHHLNGKIVFRSIQCIDCGATVFRSFSGSMPDRCDACRYDRKRLKQLARKKRLEDLEREQSKRPPKTVESLRDTSRSNCKSYSACLNDLAYDKHNECVPCKNCLNYRPEVIKFQFTHKEEDWDFYSPAYNS